ALQEAREAARTAERAAWEALQATRADSAILSGRPHTLLRLPPSALLCTGCRKRQSPCYLLPLSKNKSNPRGPHCARSGEMDGSSEDHCLCVPSGPAPHHMRLAFAAALFCSQVTLLFSPCRDLSDCLSFT
ncbi:MAG: uncharacterized protein A8A55_3279, partial [Amphiamblys sp. WSBS2006]